MGTKAADLSVRVDLLCIVVQELCRALSTAQADQVGRAVRARVIDLADAEMPAAVDEVLSGDLAPILRSLGL